MVQTSGKAGAPGFVTLAGRGVPALWKRGEGTYTS